jgi:IS30 family transposase
MATTITDTGSPTADYHHFTKDERIQLWTLKNQKYSLRYIAREIGKDASSVSRELKRNQGNQTSKTQHLKYPSDEYHYSPAHDKAKDRRKRANQARIKITVSSDLEKYILKKLEVGWSPEQIAGRLRLEKEQLKLPTPAVQTIYDHIYLHRKDYKKYLRCKKGKYRKKRGTRLREKEREELKKKRVDSRPEIIDQRKRIGDWEGDTIVGKEKSIHILTHVDRKSGYLMADKAEDASREGVQQLTLSRFNQLPKTKRKSITYDNGVQFNKYEDTEQKLGIPIYFAYPYHSSERGTNENTNGLLREYFPKKTPFKDITQKELDKKVKLINNRPRKRLNYLTPQEVFCGRRSKFVRNQSVALGVGM